MTNEVRPSRSPVAWLQAVVKRRTLDWAASGRSDPWLHPGTTMAEAVGTFEEVIALEPRHEALLRALRALAVELHPGLVEVSRPGDRAVSWGWGAKKMSEAYACALPHADHVNLAFYHGTRLPDPTGRLRGTGKLMRHASIRCLAEIAEPSLRELMVAAREERRLALGLSR